MAYEYPVRVHTQEALPLACGIEVMGPLGDGDKHKVFRSCDYCLLKGLVLVLRGTSLLRRTGCSKRM